MVFKPQHIPDLDFNKMTINILRIIYPGMRYSQSELLRYNSKNYKVEITTILQNEILRPFFEMEDSYTYENRYDPDPNSMPLDVNEMVLKLLRRISKVRAFDDSDHNWVKYNDGNYKVVVSISLEDCYLTPKYELNEVE
jgi:hypothetical protein